MTDSIDRWSKSVTVVTAIVGVVGTVVGGFTAVTGGVGRLFREQVVLTSASGALVFLASALALFSVLVFSPAGSARRNGLVLALALILVAAVMFLIAVSSLPSRPVRPSLTAALASGAAGEFRISGEASASNLRAADVLSVDVSGIDEGGARLVFRADNGPDVDGNAKLPYDVAVNASRFQSVFVRTWSGSRVPPNCNELLVDPTLGSCAQIPFPDQRGNTRLSARVVDADGGRVLSVSLKTPFLGIGDPGRIVVIKGVDERAAEVVAYSTVVRPDSNGLIDQELALPLPPDVALAVCITATPVLAEDADRRIGLCPVRPTADATTSALDSEWVAVKVQPSGGTTASMSPGASAAP